MAQTRRSLRRHGNTVSFHDEPLPSWGSADVLIRVRAVSLNWKDAALVDGRMDIMRDDDRIVGTEFSGEVVSAGDSVTLFKAGDRVVSLINFKDITGREKEFIAFGHNMDGTLTEYLVAPEIALVKIPEHLSWAEASMIPCAGLTAWSALNMTSRLRGKTVVVGGTGGVSVVSMAMATEAGAQVIITSSSDKKLQRAKELGAAHTINYSSNPDWEAEVMRLTGGVGADIVIDNVGAATIGKSVAAVRGGGQVSQVGLMPTESPGNIVDIVKAIVMKPCSIVGIRVGRKGDLEDTMEFIEATGFHLTSCIDRVFPFNESAEALEYLRSGRAMGKIIVEF